MSITLVFRTIGAWGAGKGSNLTATDVDNNFWNLAQAIENIIDNPVEAINIASVTTTGTSMTFVMSDSSTIGPIPLPVLKFRYLGVWQPHYAYAILDTFYVNGFGIFTTQLAHTSGSTFDPDIEVAGSPALLQLFGATGFTTDVTFAQLADVHLTSSLADGDFLVYVAGTTDTWQAMSPADVASGIAEHIALGDLSNVSAGSPSAGQVLTFNGDEWVPATPSGGGGGGGGATRLSALTDVEINSSLADGDVLTWSGHDDLWYARETLITNLSDVSIDSTLADGDVLTWDSGTGKWIAAPSAGGSGGGVEELSELTDVDLDSGPADGDVLTFDGTTGKWIAEVPSGGGSGGGGGVTFEDGGTWGSGNAYSAGDVVQHAIDSTGDKAFLCWKDVSASVSSSLTLDGTVSGAIGTGNTSHSVSLTTTEADDLIVVIVGWTGHSLSPGTNSVSSVTASGLTFTRRAQLRDRTGGSYDGNIEIWTAPASLALTSESIAVTMASSVDEGVIGAFGVNGTTITDPFDSNVSLPATSSTDIVSVSTSDSDTFIIFASVKNNISLETTPTGFTNIFADIADHSGLAVLDMIVCYKVESSAVTSLSLGQNSDSSFGPYIVADALAGGGTPNPEPQTDPLHWIGS